jgi:CRISPR-associated protein Csb2
MTALGIRYLTGNVVASDATREKPEWPPHPGRVFMAMAAAYFETKGTSQERAALEWLERQRPAPAILAPEAYRRSFVETYVPVNDKHGGIVARTRQARAFPTARPIRDSAFLLWKPDAPPDIRLGLEQICEKVTRIGHSSTLVQMWLAEESIDLTANWVPENVVAEQTMRVVESGTLRQLERAFNGKAIEQYFLLSEALETAKGREKSSLKKDIAEKFPHGQPESRHPQLSQWQGYARSSNREANEDAISGPFDERIVILAKDDGRVLGLESTLQLTGALRNAAMKAALEGHSPEWLTGHDSDGNPSRNPHMAFFPLPFVGADYADGHVMGLALAIPRGLQASDIRNVIGPLLFNQESGAPSNIHLWNRDLWDWRLQREMRERPPLTLSAKTWIGPGREWASVTPVVLHHYPKRNREEDVERIVREAFRSALLPEPERISTSPVSVFKGAGHARSMPEFTEGGQNLCRYQTHLKVEFSNPVVGPILVGRGRFRGYGLFHPISWREEASREPHSA